VVGIPVLGTSGAGEGALTTEGDVFVILADVDTVTVIIILLTKGAGVADTSLVPVPLSPGASFQGDTLIIPVVGISDGAIHTGLGGEVEILVTVGTTLVLTGSVVPGGIGAVDLVRKAHIGGHRGRGGQAPRRLGAGGPNICIIHRFHEITTSILHVGDLFQMVGAGFHRGIGHDIRGGGGGGGGGEGFGEDSGARYMCYQ